MGRRRFTREFKLTRPDPDGARSLTSPTVEYELNADGNVVALTDPNQHTTTYAYDALGREISTTNAERDTSYTVYDPANQIVLTLDQRGIAKTRDASKFPLSTRVYDLNCAHPMYPRTSGTRRCYACGKYINSAGQQCEHNQVDAEAALKFVLSVLKQKLMVSGGHHALRRRLVELAKIAREQQPDSTGDEAQVLAARLRDAEAELELLTLNLGRAHDQAEYDAVKRLFHAKRQELAGLRRELDKMNPRQAASDGDEGDEAEIEKALAVFDQIQSLAADDGAREALRPLFRRLNLNLWLNFGGRPQGQPRGPGSDRRDDHCRRCGAAA
jgi:YD repeat-containing protein